MKDIEITEEMKRSCLGVERVGDESFIGWACKVYKAMRAVEPSPWKKIKDLVIDESKECEAFFHRHLINDKYCYSSFLINNKDMYVYFNTPGQYDLAEFMAENPDDEYMPIP